MFENKRFLNHKADTLVEVLVASVLIMIAATVLLRTTLYGKVLTNKAIHYSQAARFASQVIGELKVKGEDDYNDSALNVSLDNDPETELGISLPDEITKRGGDANYTVSEITADLLKEINITIQWNEDDKPVEVRTATLIPNIP